MDGSSVLDDDGDRCQEAIKSAGVTWASNCALTSNQWLTALRSCISIDGPAQQSLNAHPQPGNFEQQFHYLSLPGSNSAKFRN